MAATRTIGCMQESYPDKEKVIAYLERFQMFISANSIEMDKMVPTLLTVLGSTHYTPLVGSFLLNFRRTNPTMNWSN